MAVKIFDSFTDTPGLNLRSHVADTLETYWSSLFNVFSINPAGDQARTGASTGSCFQLKATGGAVHAVGDEVWADCRRSDGPLSANIGLSLMYLMDGENPIDEYYRCEFQFDVNANDVSVEIHRVVTGVVTESLNVPGDFPWAQTTSLRVGVTIKGDDEHEIWYEPFGGGARTIFATWTPAPNVNFTGWVGDAIHKWLGLFSVLTGFETVKTEVDNLTLQESGVTEWNPIDPAMGTTTFGDC